MTSSKKLMLNGALAGLLGAGAMALMATPASAYVVCNRAGDCWHTTESAAYAPGLGITVHDDAWKWRGARYHWREHPGRGYWRSGVWINL